jgi:putative transposase
MSRRARSPIHGVDHTPLTLHNTTPPKTKMNEKVIHGAKIRLHPNEAQAAQFDLWRRRCRALWNLLLGMEQAAYSGEKFRPELKWRQKWLEVAEETYAKFNNAFEAGKRPKPPNPVNAIAILGRNRGEGEPKLFLWEDELLKTMARLKREPLCQWISEIHSHAAQQICKDLVRALRTMLTERKKRTAGKGDRDTGFPCFKKTSAYAEGSVYFANTQLVFDRSARRIKFPWGVGEMRHGDLSHIPEDAKLMGGRIFREGETWWLSAQFEFAAPAPLPKTGLEGGLKVAASVISTTIDSEGRAHQVRTPREPERHAFQMNLTSKSLSRRRRGTKAYYKQAEKLAYQHARNRNVRDDCLHKTSRAIVNAHDAIAVQKMDVGALMKNAPKQKGAKTLRKINRQAAMARFRGFVEYKAKEGGRLYHESHELFPAIQICSGLKSGSPCRKIHAIPLSQRFMVCDNCGTRLERRINAAQNELDQLQIAKLAAA